MMREAPEQAAVWYGRSGALLIDWLIEGGDLCAERADSARLSAAIWCHSLQSCQFGKLLQNSFSAAHGDIAHFIADFL